MTKKKLCLLFNVNPVIIGHNHVVCNCTQINSHNTPANIHAYTSLVLLHFFLPLIFLVALHQHKPLIFVKSRNFALGKFFKI